MRTLTWDAINPLTGTPYTYDDPNLRWGEPSIALEPGDPGFVPYPATISAKPTRSKPTRMKHQPYYPRTSAEQVLWLQNFASKLPTYAAGLGLTTAQGAALLADTRWLAHVLGTWLPAVRAWQKACTDAAQQGETGTSGTLNVLPSFTAPALPAAVGGLPAVTPVNEGALDRIVAAIGTMKDNAAATEAVQSDLGIVGAEDAGPDFATLTPKITAAVTGATVQVGWDWGGSSKHLDQIEIHVDRGDAQGWRVLTFDTTPGYTDTQAHPVALTRWKYRAIYRVGDASVGQWSAEAGVAVGG